MIAKNRENKQTKGDKYEKDFGFFHRWNYGNCGGKCRSC